MLIKKYLNLNRAIKKENSFGSPPIVLHDYAKVKRNTEGDNCCNVNKDKKPSEIIASDKFEFFHSIDVAISALSKLVNQASKIEPIVYRVKPTKSGENLIEKKRRLKSCLSKGFKAEIYKASAEESLDNKPFNFFRDIDVSIEVSHPFTSILERPNEIINTWSLFVLQWTYQSYFMPYIDCVAIKSGDDIIGVKIVSGFEVNKDFKDGKYRYSYTKNGQKQVETYSPEEVYTYVNYNPTPNKTPNLAPIDALWEVLQLYKQTFIWARDKFRGFEGTFFVVKQGEELNVPARERLSDELLEQMQDDHYGAVILDERVTNVAKDHSLKEMDYMLTHQMLRNEISAFFDVHPILMATEQAKFANFEQARLQQQEAGAIPLIQKLIEHLQPMVQDIYGADLYLWYDTTNSAGIVLEEEHKLNKILSLSRHTTIDEGRAIIGFPPHQDPKIGNLTLIDYVQNAETKNQTA